MKVFFEETQSLRNKGWVWLITIIPILTALIPLAMAMKMQILDDIQWGDKPMSNEGLVGLFFVIILASTIAVAMLYFGKIEFRIDEQGVHYKFFPYHPNWKLVKPAEIANFEVQKMKWSDTRRRVRDVRKHIRFKLSNPDILLLKLHNGDELAIGTNDPQSVLWAMKRLFGKEKIV
jgi:hypothetical protein